MTTDKAKELAEKLDGIEYPVRLSEELINQAKADGLVIVFGASDDLMEFRGAICDEVGCYDGGTALLDSDGLLPDRDQIKDDDELHQYFNRKQKAKTIEALWCEEGDYSWTYITDIPHVAFRVMEDGEPYCLGIVFVLADAAS